MTVFRRIAISLLLTLTVVLPLEAADVSGAQDHPTLTRFPGAQITEYSVQEEVVHTLVLGRMQRVNGRVTPGDSQRLQGRLVRITYEIPGGFTGEEVFAHHRQQILAEGQPALFSCQGRGCGSSNFWANEVFGNRILYGPEANQYYLAASMQDEAGLFVSVYVITRGNRRVYAHLEFLELADGAEAGVEVSPRALLNRLVRDGSVVLPGLVFSAEDELLGNPDLELAVAALQLDPLLEVYVVAHLREQGNLETLMQRSSARAGIVREAILEAGIDADRVLAAGVGPLAPVCQEADCGERVELVLQP